MACIAAMQKRWVDTKKPNCKLFGLTQNEPRKGKPMIQFNTGRQYSKQGQRIVAAQVDDGRIFFVDLDRCIDGMITAPNAELTEASVLKAYDANQYRWVGHPILRELVWKN